jgi:hypothetical protein
MATETALAPWAALPFPSRPVCPAFDPAKPIRDFDLAHFRAAKVDPLSLKTP